MHGILMCCRIPVLSLELIHSTSRINMPNLFSFMNCCSTVSKGLSFLDMIPEKLVVLGQFCINCLILGIKRQLCSRCLTGMSEKLSTCYPKRGDAKDTLLYLYGRFPKDSYGYVMPFQQNSRRGLLVDIPPLTRQCPAQW